jgi:hypothetical protein
MSNVHQELVASQFKLRENTVVKDKRTTQLRRLNWKEKIKQICHIVKNEIAYFYHIVCYLSYLLTIVYAYLIWHTCHGLVILLIEVMDIVNCSAYACNEISVLKPDLKFRTSLLPNLNLAIYINPPPCS